MIASLRGQLADWHYGRSIVKDFLTMLSDADLDRRFPRRHLNSIRKQCEELVQIQGCYVDALASGKIRFDLRPLPCTARGSLIARMDELDRRLEKYLAASDGAETIEWHGERWNIHRHLSAMIGHEQMHIGQIVAFCYAVDIEIPSKVVKVMALNG